VSLLGVLPSHLGDSGPFTRDNHRLVLCQYRLRCATRAFKFEFCDVMSSSISRKNTSSTVSSTPSAPGALPVCTPRRGRHPAPEGTTGFTRPRRGIRVRPNRSARRTRSRWRMGNVARIAWVDCSRRRARSLSARAGFSLSPCSHSARPSARSGVSSWRHTRLAISPSSGP